VAFKKSVARPFGVLFLALTPWILLAIGVHAQPPPNLPLPSAYRSIPNFSGGVGAGLQFRQAINDRLSDVQPIAPTIVTGSKAGGDSIAEQVTIPHSTVKGAPAIRDAPMKFAASMAKRRLDADPLNGQCVDGCFNPIAYGADPTGASDNSVAFTNTYAAACRQNNGTVCLPVGQYKFLAPWLAMCPSSHSGYTPSIVGAGATASVLINAIGVFGIGGGGPLLEIAGPTVVSSFGGAATLISAGLTGSGGNSFNWGPRGTPPAALFNLDQILGDQALNGRSQLDMEVIFNTTTNSANEYMISSDGSATPIADGCNFVGPNGSWTCKGAASISLGSDGKLYGSINTSVTGWTGPSLLHSASAVGAGSNQLVELSYSGSFVRLYHGPLGGTSTMDAKVAQTGTVLQRTDENLVVGAMARYWSMVEPTNFWQGKMDSVRISTVARCTSDSGCAIPSAKLAGDSSTLIIENWTNVSNLPLVEPEYINGFATDTNLKQAWMAMYNEGLGNSAGNSPVLRDFGISGGQVGIHVNVVSPHIERLNLAFGSGAPKYGIMLDLPSDYSSTIDNVVMSSGVIPIVDEGGIDAFTRLSITCGVACMETIGSSIRDALLLPPSSTRWGIILSSPTSLDDIILDTENGGAFTVIQASNMNRNRLPGFGLTNSFIAAWGAGQAPVTLDGQYGRINIGTAELAHGTGVTGPMVNVTNGRQGASSSIIFENNSYDLRGEPSDIAGNSYVSATDNLAAPVTYAVVGGGSTRQTTLTGTTDGTVVWSMPGEGSSSKRFVGHYIGYKNAAGQPQTITYPVAFSVAPKISINDGPPAATSTTVLTLPASMESPVTGWITVEGY
jgi:hypothetical protein